jgi:hypothetical protein
VRGAHYRRSTNNEHHFFDSHYYIPLQSLERNTEKRNGSALAGPQQRTNKPNKKMSMT